VPTKNPDKAKAIPPANEAKYMACVCVIMSI
jgi:hypothetical protein